MTQKLYKVEVPEFWVAVAADSYEEAQRTALADLKEVLREMRWGHLDPEEIQPDDPELQMYLDNWGGDESELDDSYFLENDDA